jgi:hypothetical protein
MNITRQRKALRRSHERTMGKLRARRAKVEAWAQFLGMLGIAFLTGSAILIGAAMLAEAQRAAF